MAPPVVEGDILAGKYRVERVLGRGGMGLVVAAMHLQLNERVALKFLLPAAAAEPEFASRFQREGQLMARLRSQHIARVSDVGVLDTGAPYMVMEYLEGLDLRAVIREGAKLPFETAVDYILQACEGVAEAHALGIVHRDLKPTNLFLTHHRDGTPLIKVLDFGISKAPEEDDDSVDNQLTGLTSVLGSPRYMPPEQLRSSRTVDARADVWALAAIFQELVSGEPPFRGNNTTALCASIIGDPPVPLRERRPDAPEALEALLLHCFEKNPDARVPNVAVLARGLANAVLPDDPTADLMVVRTERLLMSASGTASGRLLSTTGSRAAGRELSRSGNYAQFAVGADLKPNVTPMSSGTPRGISATPMNPRISSSALSPELDTQLEASTQVVPSKRGRSPLLLAAMLLGVLVLGVAGASFFLRGGRDGAQPASAASAGVSAAPSSAEPQVTAPVAIVSASPLPLVPAATAPVAVDPPSSPPSGRVAPGGRRGGGAAGPPAAKPPPAEPPPAAVPVVPVSPPKEKPPRANPLEDRQ